MSEKVQPSKLQGVSRSALLDCNTLDGGGDTNNADSAETEEDVVDNSTYHTSSMTTAVFLNNDDLMSSIMGRINITDDNNNNDHDSNRMLKQFGTDDNVESSNNNNDEKEINVNAVVGVTEEPLEFPIQWSNTAVDGFIEGRSKNDIHHYQKEINVDAVFGFMRYANNNGFDVDTIGDVMRAFRDFRSNNNHDHKEINVNDVLTYLGYINNNHYQKKNYDVVGAINNHDNTKDTTTTTTTTTMTPLIEACLGGHGEVVRELLNDKTIDVNVSNSDGVTVLMVACDLGHLEIVLELLSPSLSFSSDDKNAVDNDDETQVMVDVNAQHKRDGYTALILASDKAHWDVVHVLLNHPNIDANLCCNSGYTALIVASRNGYSGVVRVLLKQHKKVNVNASCNQGRTAFFWACQEGHSDVVCEFLRHDTIVDAGVVNAQDKGGLTPLMVASMKDRSGVVRILLNDERVDIYARDRRGRTAFLFVRGDSATAWRKRFPILVMGDPNGISSRGYPYKTASE